MAVAGPPTPPGPPLPGPPEGNLEGLQNDGAGHCTMRGWCSGARFSGPPRQVRVVLDRGAVVANGTAAIHRRRAGDHGFELAVPCTTVATPGKHLWDVACFDPVRNEWAALSHSPICTTSGKVSPC
eukprot:COSAG01_NODE_6390_length_3698_cov_1.671298_2_plen_126_part_00